MITTVILSVLYYAIYGVLAVTILLLSDVSANSNVTSALTHAITYAATWNTFLPIGTIFTVFAAVISIELVITTYRVVLFVIKLIRG